MIGQTLDRKLKIKQHKPAKMHGMILCVRKFWNGQEKNDKKQIRGSQEPVIAHLDQSCFQ